jgi:ribosome biogenesis protein Tsr3
MASISKDDFDADTYLIEFDSEDKKKFENCTFRNLYRYYALYFFDELEKISFTFRKNVVENVVTYESPMMIEASNLYIYDCTFRKVKSKGQGGAMFQKYSVDGLD